MGRRGDSVSWATIGVLAIAGVAAYLLLSRLDGPELPPPTGHSPAAGWSPWWETGTITRDRYFHQN